MKQGNSSTLSVKISGVEISQVDTVKFIFKTTRSRDAEAVKVAEYPANVSATEDAFLIPWTAEETNGIEGGTVVYMGTRVTINGTTDMPDTPIVAFRMNPTLFEEE